LQHLSAEARILRNKGVRVFEEASKLIGSGAIDAIVIATPHPQHPAQGIAAFQEGLHVMVEKPIASHKADAERLIAVARKHPGQKFAAMFQLRTEPRYTKIRKLIQSGELGQLVRINWIITDWPGPRLITPAEAGAPRGRGREVASC
jgi:predicted dehydrogenase